MNTNALYFAIVGAIIGSIFAVGMFRRSQQGGAGVYKKISPAEAKEMMDSGGVVILDVRTVEEFAEGHIKNAELIPDYEINLAPKQIPDYSQTLLVYCRSGKRSERASAALVEMGYTSVYDFGGIIDWPYEIVK